MDSKKVASCSMNHLQCDHRMAIEGIKRGQELTNQIRDALGFAATSEPVNRLFNGIQNSLNNALCGLQCVSNASSSKSQEKKKNPQEGNNHSRNLRRRNIEVSITTPTPHYDGYQWRKYGEKHINGSKHERCYYRCTYNKDLKCPATKTVQREDGPTAPPLYSVIYYNRHMCNHWSSENKPFVIDFTNSSEKEASTSGAYEQGIYHSASSSMELNRL